MMPFSLLILFRRARGDEMKNDYDLYGESDAYSKSDVDFAARGFGWFLLFFLLLAIGLLLLSLFN